MEVVRPAIEEIMIIQPDVYSDDRGFFMETFRQERYGQIGIKDVFVQDNLSGSRKHTLRGLHFQVRHPQAKLVQVVCGEIYDVAVDVRSDSRTFGRWVGIHLSERNRKQLYIPAGFAHGFCVVSDWAVVSYKSSEIYHPEDEGGIRWCDPELNIQWPASSPILSDKDRLLPMLSALK